MDDYTAYLMTRSRIAYWYRKYILYPKLREYCTDSILDFGCGIGDFVVTTPNCDGYDPNESLEKVVTGRGGTFIHRENLNLKAYSTIVFDNVLEHIAELDSFFSTVVSECRKNCIYIIGVPLITGYATDTDHKYYLTSEKLEQLFGNNGITKVAEFTAPFNNEYLDKNLRQGCFYIVGQLNA